MTPTHTKNIGLSVLQSVRAQRESGDSVPTPSTVTEEEARRDEQAITDQKYVRFHPMGRWHLSDTERNRTKCGSKRGAKFLPLVGNSDAEFRAELNYIELGNLCYYCLKPDASKSAAARRESNQRLADFADKQAFSTTRHSSMGSQQSDSWRRKRITIGQQDILTSSGYRECDVNSWTRGRAADEITKILESRSAQPVGDAKQ